MLNFFVLAVSAGSRAGDQRSDSAPGSGRNCCASTGLGSASDQPVSILFLVFSHKRHSNHPFYSCCDGISMRQERPLIDTQSYVQLERLIGLRVSGHMTLRVFVYPCCHHRMEPRLQSLSCPYSFNESGYPQDFAGSLEQNQFLLKLTSLSCSRVGTAISCSFFSALASR